MSENKEFDDYLKSLCESLGYSEEETLLPSAHGNDRLRWAAMIQLKVIDLKAQLSSKEQECDQFKSQIESLHAENKDSEKELVSVIESLRAENERLGKIILEEPFQTIEKLRKRCEELEAALDKNGLSWTYKKLSQ